MRTDPAPRITPRDLDVLQSMLGRMVGDEPLAIALRRKLEQVRIVPAEHLAPDVVTLGSRVRFRIGDAPSQDAIVVSDQLFDSASGHMSLANPRGLAMLGLSVGASVDIAGEAGPLTIVAVLLQPEAEHKRRGPRMGLRVVSSRDDLGPAAPEPQPPHPFDDDPGPSAA